MDTTEVAEKRRGDDEKVTFWGGDGGVGIMRSKERDSDYD